jgi:MoaA/NifB/PqqE/SkfB family radical SAM enzyme
MAGIRQKVQTARINPGLVPRFIWSRLKTAACYELSSLMNEWDALPETINLYPTARCNLKCKMCFARRYQAKSELDYEQWCRVIDEIASFKPRVHLSGGEPCLHPRIIDIIRHIKKFGLYVHITTNGTQLARQAGDLVSSEVNQLDISIDGPADVHDAIRGKPGTYRLIDEGLNALGRARSRSALPLVRINSIINFEDPGAMGQIVHQAERWGVQTVQFIYPLYLKPEEVAGHQALLESLLHRDLNYWKFAAGHDPAPPDLDKAWSTVETLRRLIAGSPLRIDIFPDFTRDAFSAYYDRSRDFYRSYTGSCRAMWNTATILPTGEVESCPDYVVGDCGHEAFKTIWNNQIMKPLRRRIRDLKFFSVCRACCFFYPARSKPIVN